MLRNIKNHSIVISPTLIKYNWHVYEKRYAHIENNIHHQKIPELELFKLSRKDKYTYKFSKAVQEIFFPEYSNYFAIVTKTHYLYRAKIYYPQLYKKKDIKEFQKDINHLLAISKEVLSSNESKIIFIYLDNIRNLLLIVLSAIHTIYREVMEEQLLRQLYYFRILKILELVENLYWLIYNNINYSFEGNIPFKLRDYAKDINASFVVINKYIENFKEIDSSINKIIRRYREADNPECLKFFGDKISKCYLPRDMAILGIEYGGIELPYVINNFRRLSGKSEFPIFTISISKYSKSRKYDDIYPFIIKTNFKDKKFEDYDNLLILDDSVTTGRTIKTLISTLENSFNNIYVAFYKFKVSNRKHHLQRFNHGGINPEVLQRSIISCIANYSNTYTEKLYTDEKGVFDIEKYKTFNLLSRYYE